MTRFREFALLGARLLKPIEIDQLSYDLALCQIETSDSRSDQFVQGLFDSRAFDLVGQQREADAAQDRGVGIETTIVVAHDEQAKE